MHCGKSLSAKKDGDTVEDILPECPDLEREDILACIANAAASMKFEDKEVVLQTGVLRNGKTKVF